MSPLLVASIRNNPRAWGTVSLAVARWQRGSSTGSVINGYLTVLSTVLWLGVVALWGGIALGSNFFSRPLTMIAKVSPRFVTSQAKCLLRSLTPTARR